MLVLELCFACEHFEADAFQARRGACEIGVHQLSVEANRLENLRSLITLQRRNTHLGESLQQAFLHRVDKVLRGKFRSNCVRQLSSRCQVFDALQRQIRIDGACPISAEQRKVHDLARLA